MLCEALEVPVVEEDEARDSDVAYVDESEANVDRVAEDGSQHDGQSACQHVILVRSCRVVVSLLKIIMQGMIAALFYILQLTV